MDFGSRNDSLPRHKKEIIGSKCNRDEIANVATLKQSFPECKKFASCENDADFSGFGYCLVRQYPETRSLTLAQTLTSGKSYRIKLLSSTNLCKLHPIF